MSPPGFTAKYGSKASWSPPSQQAATKDKDSRRVANDVHGCRSRSATCVPEQIPLGLDREGRRPRFTFLQTFRQSLDSDVNMYAEHLLFASLNQTALRKLFVTTTTALAPLSNFTNTSAEDVPDVAEFAGVKANAAGDLSALLSALTANMAIITAATLFFSFVRRLFPRVYQDRAKPGEIPDTFFGWIRNSLSLSIDDITCSAGLDHAMLIEFTHLSMRILLAIGAPLVLCLCPLHLYYGGDAAGEDLLSSVGMANVERGSWLCWVHAGFVWYVILVTRNLIFDAQAKFMPRRMRWLKAMPAPRATTVLVEGIPDGKNTEQQLRRFFDDGVFGRTVVRDAYVVKDTSELTRWLQTLEQNKTMSEQLLKGKGRGKGMVKSDVHKQMISNRTEAERQVERLQKEIGLREDSSSRSAFVTFDTRREAAVALKLLAPGSDAEMIVSVPPDPSDVIWADLLVDERAQAVREIIGYALIVGLFFAFMPIVIGIASIASLATLRNEVPFFDDLIRNHPEVSTTWDGLVGSMALTAMMSFLPTFLILIFNGLFVLKARAWLQHRVQQWYFYFQVVFVLLVTAVGSSLLSTTAFVVAHPFKVFALLANRMPRSTHFYLKFFPVQWGTHAMNLTRNANLAKFVCFRSFYGDEEKAKELSEPEDQDYFGMGSRSARFTLLLVAALVFCSLAPLITVLAFINFAICRVFYGHLFAYAETRKPDLGGVFWCTMLRHLQQGLFLYTALMTGVLAERSRSWVPSAISASTFIFMARSYAAFKAQFRWENIKIDDLRAEDEAVETREPTRISYSQPELPIPQPRNMQEPVATPYHASIATVEKAKVVLRERLGVACI